MTLRIDIEEQPEERDLRTIETGLIGHAAAAGIEPRNHRPLTIFLRDGERRAVGGLVGTTVWGWLQVTQLWVLETLRGKGHGAALMSAAEEEAVRRGCHHALLDTFDFQARGFYERLGYETFGEAREFPTGHTRFFMRRALRVELASRTDEADVRRFLDSYRDAFNRLDAGAVAHHFCVPSTMSSNDGYAVWTDGEQVLANMRALCDRYRTAGFAEARYELLDVVVQPPAHAFANVLWTIHRREGRRASRFRTSYNLRREAGEWRVLLCTAYEER